MVSHQNNHYDVLGVSRQASPDQIRSRYRELVRCQHPDMLGGRGHSAFQQITRSYEVLQDLRRRAEYDATLQAMPSPHAPLKRPVGKPEDPAALLRSPAMQRLLCEAEGDALIEAGQHEEALASYRNALGRNPNPPLEAKIARLMAMTATPGRAVEQSPRPISFTPKTEDAQQPFWQRWLKRDRAAGPG